VLVVNTMLTRKLQKLAPGEIRPEGFIRRVLGLQAAGLTGKITEIWPDLFDDSGWLGGRGESWERGPYYLDGLIPLAYLLEDQGLIRRACKWIDAIIESQQESGFFGPPWNLDWWPRAVVLKALVPYYRTTGDLRIIPFMRKYLQYQIRRIDEQPPHFWAAARALEAVEAMELVYRETGDPQPGQLADKLKNYMFDWFGSYINWPYCRPTDVYLNRTLFNLVKSFLSPLDRLAKNSRKLKPPDPVDKILAFNRNKLIETYTFTHGVNVAMALKYPVTFGLLSEQADDRLQDLPLKAYEQLMACHGLATGLFSADEHLNGPDPAAGTELCVVVELLYSLQELLSVTGDSRYADLIELLAYNALPATFTDDMCCHQYLQQANQVAADKRRRNYYDANSEANIYGLEPNYGCCTANLHQGFPKLLLSSCFKTGDGLAFMVYLPCLISIKTAAGQNFAIRQLSDYPFVDKIVFEIIDAENVDLKLLFRVPSLTRGKLFYNGDPVGESGPGILELQKTFNCGDQIELLLDVPLTKVSNPDGSISIRKGSLLLALKIEAELKILKGSAPFNDRQYLPRSKWNFAPLLDGSQVEVLRVRQNPLPEKPFDADAPPLEVEIRGVEVINWALKQNSAGPYPAEPAVSDPLIMTLVPYGSTNIRIAQFPEIKRQKSRSKVEEKS
jgi:uncharacterized protein